MNWRQIIGIVLLWCSGMVSLALADELPHRSRQYRNDLIRASRVIWGLNAPVADFAAQLHQESGWKSWAVSPVGAQGMAQFMPATANWISQRIPELSNKEPFNPTWSMRAMVHYDHWLWLRIKAVDKCQRMAMVLSSYNGGLGWLLRDKKKTEVVGLNPWVWFGHVESQNAGRRASAWKENRHYSKRILLELAPRYLAWGGTSCAN
ncbi:MULTISPECIES: transglycosylase SLT domain-containing protein [Photorhabdus]|uniref:transglycosylase SLT domain-containing protein n=1 Tax=Photorhabdus TaxID=29487 RepID=UPI0021D504D4|nr:MULTISPECIES: transglycosylase SLT domain-containing protein [Photorhabdus]MCT8350362.1 transglycosylase SLT domain-containing protein [Photorhabdus kayaii]MDB6367265.1 transglycosylase SLT domain-containing protein [Photorhabdus bodei]